MKLLPTAVGAIALFSIPGHGLSAQVIINEVSFTKNAQFIEFFNKGTTTVNLGKWSIYHETKTPNRFRDYWWGFPSSAQIKGGEYLQVNWGGSIQTNPPPRVINTGSSPWNFLFGHGYEPLDPDLGAIAICTTQDNKLVDSTNVFNDWWQWGATGFKRGSLATGNKPTALWNVNQTLTKIPAGASLIVIDTLVGFPHALSSFDHDFSPTPGRHNSDFMRVRSFQKPCSLNTKDSILSTRGNPFVGSRSFKLVTSNTRGPAYFESMFYIVSVTGQLQRFSICDKVLSLTGAVVTPFFATTNSETVLPVPLDKISVSNGFFYIQGVVFTAQSFSFTNHLIVDLGLK